MWNKTPQITNNKPVMFQSVEDLYQTVNKINIFKEY